MKTQKIKAFQSERGQSIMVLALVMVGLLGFTALAVDGGMIFFERRRAQAAADSSAIAAALASVDQRDYNQAGLEQALANGFDNNGTSNTVTIHKPPISGPYAGNGQYFQVIITTITEPIFSQVVFGNELENVVEAMSRAIPNQNISLGNAIHATSPNSCKAVWFSGNNTSIITGGDVFSNSTADGTSGGSSCISGTQSGSSGTVTVNQGGIKVAGAWTQANPGTVTADEGILTGVEQQPLPPVPTPDCTGLPTYTYNKTNPNIDPGNYPGGIKVTNEDLVMAPGIYCLGGNFDSTGGSINGIGVMINQVSGNFSLGGNTSVNLHASNDLVDNSGTQWAGMLLYMNTGNTGQVSMSGGANSTYTGTIFAPGPASPATKSKCIITGNGENFSVNSQLICYSIEMTGTSDINITFNANENFHMPPLIELVQ